MQDSILTFRDSQALIEHRESQLSRDLCVEIENYDRLRLLWGYGHLRLRPRCKKRAGSFKMERFLIYGECEHSDGEKSFFYLGDRYPLAFSHCSQLRIQYCAKRMQMNFSAFHSLSVLFGEV